MCLAYRRLIQRLIAEARKSAMNRLRNLRLPAAGLSISPVGRRSSGRWTKICAGLGELWTGICARPRAGEAISCMQPGGRVRGFLEPRSWGTESRLLF